MKTGSVNSARLWLGRILIGAVLLWNVQCALAFIIMPGRITDFFELSGAVGEAVIRSVGVLFLMWNVPYAVAFSQPMKRRISLLEAIVMQAIGVVGELWIYFLLPDAHGQLSSSLRRFLFFDLSGLILLAAAAWVTKRKDGDHG